MNEHQLTDQLCQYYPTITPSTTFVPGLWLVSLDRLNDLPHIQGQSDLNPKTISKMGREFWSDGLGLINPIHVLLDISDGVRPCLLAGRHRLHAISELALAMEADKEQVMVPTLVCSGPTSLLLYTNNERKFRPDEKANLTLKTVDAIRKNDVPKLRALELRQELWLLQPELSQHFTSNTLYQLCLGLVKAIPDVDPNVVSILLQTMVVTGTLPQNKARQVKTLTKTIIDHIQGNTTN